MSENLPLITIGISCYNSSDTSPDAVRSALAQDWPNIEVLIADDGSTDDTAESILNVIEGHENARLMIYDQNKGFAGSLNTIINEAKGDFLAIFDDDDVSAPDRVTKQYERIINYEKAHNVEMIICHTARTQVFANKFNRYEATMGTNLEGLAPHGQDVADRILTGKLTPNVVGSCANCSRMARIDTFKEMGGYDDSIRRGEDTDFNIRFALKGGHFVGIEEPLVTQLMTMGDEKRLDREQEVETAILLKNKDYLESKGWFEFSMLWIQIRYDYYKNKYLQLLLKLIKLTVSHPLKLIKKMKWVIPANSTRSAFKKWHHEKLEG